MEKLIELLRAERKSREQMVSADEKERLAKEKELLINSEKNKNNNNICIKCKRFLVRRKFRKNKKKGD